MGREFEVSLHPGQAAIYNSPARFKVVAAGRRFGKSHFAAISLAENAMVTSKQVPWTDAAGNTRIATHPLTLEHGVYYVAPTFDQAKRVMWPKLKELLKYEAQGGLIQRENVNDGWLELISGRRIYIKGADNPDSLRGIGLSHVVMDEYADMREGVWDEIIDPALMDVQGTALFIGTPKGKNHFYKLFMGALHQQPGFEDWEAFHFKSMDNPFLDRRELERMMNASNRPREVIQQEIEASFMSGGGKVLKREWFDIVDAMPYNGEPMGNAYVATDVIDEGSIYVTVDLAGFKKQQGNKILRTDETVIAVTYVTPEAWYVMDMQHGHWDARECALRIIRTCSQFYGCRLGVEKGALFNAIGPYLEDEMRRFGKFVTAEPLAHGGTRKIDRIAHALQGRAERGRIKLLNDQCPISRSRKPWNEHFLIQASDFPDPLAHDDLLDALSYVDQMASVSWANTHDIVEWEALDLDSGY